VHIFTHSTTKEPAKHLPQSNDGDEEANGIGRGVHHRENCKSTGFIIYTVSVIVRTMLQ